MGINEFNSKQCSENDMLKTEAKLKRKGYRLVNKTNMKDLLPFEYTKSLHQGSAQSFEGPTVWTFQWLEE